MLQSSTKSAALHCLSACLFVCVCTSVANIWKPKSNKFYGKNDFVHLAPVYLPFLFDISFLSASASSTASCCLRFIRFYCVTTLNWLKIASKRLKSLCEDCVDFRVAEFSCEQKQFSQFHKISLLLEIKVHFSAEIKAIRPTELGSPHTLPIVIFLMLFLWHFCVLVLLSCVACLLCSDCNKFLRN